ncbi:hypothetical protein OG21DRAFT_1395564, partial [Imleria badia]
IHKFMTKICSEHFEGLLALHYIKCNMDDDMDVSLPLMTSKLMRLSVMIEHHHSSQLLHLLYNSDKQASLYGTAPLWPKLCTLSL